ncbi:hypothetical protein [Nocardia abscessus]|uniref:hypothetical protein n=1 Tax=Nocardia abscessus TaxID=120957 RepID=UPI002458FD31|nr:hypothetical protein [Nocardia abscessus]
MLMVAGEIDVATAPRFRAELACAFVRRAATLVGRGADRSYALARIVLITTVRPVDRAIEGTGLADRFHRVASLDAALVDLSPGYDEPA